VTVLAHGGGAPEAAVIGLPLVLFALFFLLERRARGRRSLPPGAGDEASSGADPGSEPPHPGHPLG
jgi:hypothetical protein